MSINLINSQKKALNYFRIHQNSQKHKDYNSALIYHLHIITATTRTLFFATSTIISFHLKSSRNDDYNNNNKYKYLRIYGPLATCVGILRPPWVFCNLEWVFCDPRHRVWVFCDLEWVFCDVEISMWAFCDLERYLT